jgi:hypothetical protein
MIRTRTPGPRGALFHWRPARTRIRPHPSNFPTVSEDMR